MDKLPMRRSTDKWAKVIPIALVVHLLVAVYQYGKLTATLEILVSRVERIERRIDGGDSPGR